MFIVSESHKCIKLDIKIGNKTCNFVCLCRSPSKTKDEFENVFIKNLEFNLEKNPFLIAVLGNFNARMQSWYQSHITTFKGCKVIVCVK